MHANSSHQLHTLQLLRCRAQAARMPHSLGQDRPRPRPAQHSPRTQAGRTLDRHGGLHLQRSALQQARHGHKQGDVDQVGPHRLQRQVHPLRQRWSAETGACVPLVWPAADSRAHAPWLCAQRKPPAAACNRGRCLAWQPHDSGGVLPVAGRAHAAAAHSSAQLSAHRLAPSAAGTHSLPL